MRTHQGCLARFPLANNFSSIGLREREGRQYLALRKRYHAWYFERGIIPNFVAPVLPPLMPLLVEPRRPGYVSIGLLAANSFGTYIRE